MRWQSVGSPMESQWNPNELRCGRQWVGGRKWWSRACNLYDNITFMLLSYDKTGTWISIRRWKPEVVQKELAGTCIIISLIGPEPVYYIVDGTGTCIVTRWYYRKLYSNRAVTWFPLRDVASSSRLSHLTSCPNFSLYSAVLVSSVFSLFEQII